LYAIFWQRFRAYVVIRLMVGGVCIVYNHASSDWVMGEFAHKQLYGPASNNASSPDGAEGTAAQGHGWV